MQYVTRSDVCNAASFLIKGKVCIRPEFLVNIYEQNGTFPSESMYSSALFLRLNVN